MAKVLQEDDNWQEDARIEHEEEMAKIFETVGNQVRGLNLEEDEENGGPKLVDEIESLCMNCGKDVSL